MDEVRGGGSHACMRSGGGGTRIYTGVELRE